MRVRAENKPSGRYEVYICTGRESGAAECNQRAVKRALIDSNVLAYFESVALDVEAMVAEFAGDRDRRLADVGARKQNASGVAVKAEERLSRLDALLADGELEPAEWRRLSEPHLRDRAAAEAALADLLGEQHEVEHEADAADAEQRVLEGLAEVRAAVADEIAGAEQIEAAQAAIRRVFSHFVLHDSLNPGDYALEAVPHAEAIEDMLVCRDAETGEIVGYVEGGETLKRTSVSFAHGGTRDSRR